MMDLFTGYVVSVGILHGVNPSMGWLLGVYHAIRNKSVKDLCLAQLAVAAGHVLSILLTLGPLYYFFSSNMVPSWIAGVSILVYVTYRLLRRGRHRYLGLTLGLKKLSIISFLLALQHASALSLLPIICTPTTLNILKPSLFEILATHGLGVMAGIYSASIITYVLGMGVLRKMWINFEALWLGVLLVTGFATVLAPLFI